MRLRGGERGMKKQIFINGEWTGENLEEIKVFNPANGELVGSVPKAGEKETAEAIDAAHDAFESWSSLTAYERASYLKKFHQLIINQKDEIAEIITKEMGKPLNESKGEVDYAASFIEWFAEQGKRVYGESVPSHLVNRRIQVWKKPVGVVAAITPWNFPAAMLTRKMGPALAAGCTVVIKPAGETPLTAVKLVELCNEAGFPKGVVNLVTGSSSKIGAEIMSNKKVRKVTFTGSTEVGKLLAKQASNQMKRLSLELGGHAPMIVLDDADLDKAVQGVIASKFRNAGQTCICVNRIYVQEKIYDRFIEKFAEAASSLKVGNGLDKNVDIGPLINKEGIEKVDQQVRDAISKGAKLVIGGTSHNENGGCFYQATILKDVSSSMLVMNEETFGPVAPIQKIESDEEAVRLANDSPYGLAAYVFTENLSRGIKIIEKLDYGIVGWNDGTPSAAQAPFGGMKESGIGREGSHHGIEEFLEVQYVSIGL